MEKEELEQNLADFVSLIVTDAHVDADGDCDGVRDVLLLREVRADSDGLDDSLTVTVPQSDADGERDGLRDCVTDTVTDVVLLDDIDRVCDDEADEQGDVVGDLTAVRELLRLTDARADTDVHVETVSDDELQLD